MTYGHAPTDDDIAVLAIRVRNGQPGFGALTT
jgi:hypothetical protein